MLALFLIFFVINCVFALPSYLPFYHGKSLAVDSGYIQVDNIRLFYLHVESLKNPSTDPVYVSLD